MIIDDEQDVRKLLSIGLCDAGFQVYSAADGERGLRICHQHSPQIVVVDIGLAGMGGIEVLERIKREDAQTEVIVMTGPEEMDLAIRALRLKASDFITKPVDHEALLVAVDRAKERYDSRRSLRASEEKYSNLVENSLTGIYIDFEGRIEFANSQFAAIYGYTKDEIIGIESERLVHPDDRKFVLEIRKRRLQGEQAPSVYEARGITKDGRTIWVTRRNTRIAYEGAYAVLGNVVDITQRKQHKETLRKKEEQSERERHALIMGLAEVFDALHEISLGNPEVQIPETSEVDLIEELKSIVNMTAQNFREIVELSHEFAMGLAEHFDVLLRVSRGDLAARVTGTSKVELLESLRGMTNQMIDSVAGAIRERERAEAAARNSETNYRRMSRALTLGLVEVFDALSQIAQGNPYVRVPEASDLELLVDLKHLVNLTAENIEEIVELSHEFAVGLAEDFDVLHRVAKGDLKARVAGVSRVELLEALKDITNKTIQSVSKEIAERKRAEAALQQAHHDLEVRVEQRTAELTAANQRLLHEIEERKRAEINLKASEEKYRLLFDHDPNPLLVVDVGSGQILDVNDAATANFGYGKKALTSTSFWELFAAEDALRVRKELTAVTGKAPFFLSRVWAVKKGGGRFIVELHARSAMAGVKDAAVGEVLIIRAEDITQRLEQEANLAQAGKMATLGEMATGIAHELNQPLNVIQVGADFFTKMIKRGQQISEEQLVKTCRNMQEQVDRASRIINHLREFGRKSDLEYYPVDLNEPIRDVFTILGRQLRLRKITVDSDLWPEPVTVLADRNRLEQVFLNLVTNARDAMETGESSEKRLTITTRLKDGKAIAVVSDTGAGIPAEIREKIFQPFFTTKEVGKGTGLGLSISYNLVRDFKGEIDVRSSEGRGTTFTISFPEYRRH